MKNYKVFGTFTSGETFEFVIKNVSNPFSAMSIVAKCYIKGMSYKGMSAFPIR